MVKGLEIFRQHFQAFEQSFVLIGGAACDDWFSYRGLPFRVTKDLDIVLIIEVVDQKFVAALRRFIDDGGYEIRQRTEDKPILYRFKNPKNAEYPAMLELFSRSPEGLDLGKDQRIIPIAAGENTQSLSAILMDGSYYRLILDHCEDRDGLAMATITALIPLKARAWLDLNEREAAGEEVDGKDVGKHRADVFRLAGSLPADAGPELAETIKTDLRRFLDAFPENSPEWTAILAALKLTFGGNLKPANLIDAIRSYFRL
ncbi:MAG TPA: hypothetical protein VFA51_09100 [Candidatus Udaeobacter sp.]|nr:hypothetical protein [Candidatus Udaeobacter sp.]